MKHSSKNRRNIIKIAVWVILAIVIVASLLLAALPARAQTPPAPVGSTTVTLTAGDCRITKDAGGQDVIDMDGFAISSSPGDPMLPYQIVDVFDWVKVKRIILGLP